MILEIKKKIFFALIFSFLIFPYELLAQDAGNRVEIFISPRSGSFAEGSTFEIPVFINTNGASIDGINIRINYDRDRLSIVEPSGGRSIIGFWTQSPSYDNTAGTVSYVGTIPGGIVTESGLVASITFKAIGSGLSKISINTSSQVMLNDGLETKATLDLGRAEYNIVKKLSEGVSVFSETHPSEGKWYNNNSPILSWAKDDKVAGFSFELDNKPFTIPDNILDGYDTTKSFENITDGLWYFHIKAEKNGAWGTTGHFIIKIDTVPPAPFTPETNSFTASAILAGRTLVSFFTTDNLSGVDHYEVGTIDKNQPISQAPVFIESGSPFQVPVLENSTLKVIVRAFDKAGNIREGYVEVAPPLAIWQFFKNNLSLLIILCVLVVFGADYFRKSHRSKHPDTFNALEADIKNYVTAKKEMEERNFLEKEKITALEKDLENIKADIDRNTENRY